MTESERPKLGAILLAAGSSSRLGRPKQLVEFEGETLLRRSARALYESVFTPVVVVLGAEVEASLAEVRPLAVTTVVNREWASGMSSSIRMGLAELLRIEPAADGVLITLCDLPRVSVAHLNMFAARFYETAAPVIASAYSKTSGVPALFSSRLFDDLAALMGDKGARSLIRGHADVETIDLPEAAFDIDTVADLVPPSLSDRKRD